MIHPMSLLVPLKILFLDTEFTSLGDPWPSQLVSAGLADCEGRPLFYAEADDFDPRLVHEFTRRHVIPLLERQPKAVPYAKLCEAFFGAIHALGEPCALAADSHWDWLWVQMMASRTQDAHSPALLDDPSGLPLWPANLSPRMAKINFWSLPAPQLLASSQAASEHFKNKHAHHALVDAVGNAKRCKAAIESSSGLNCSDPASFCKVFNLPPESLSWLGSAA